MEFDAAKRPNHWAVRDQRSNVEADGEVFSGRKSDGNFHDAGNYVVGGSVK
ncbi:hypothetical protein M378DRAFT_17132 [Amanita muscaria Koide BX008]|uniref:Uncharacterized protein n=1 Tax=Amanita muscaria (strain Koide BX008) TaxID=946122 RepID=A0A0C2WI87_AMAMK|nr:hypothetical protein M378DRAFT_17132 [Amanita muscaria Koide BX008]